MLKWCKSNDYFLLWKIFLKKVVKKFGQFPKRHYLCTALRNNSISEVRSGCSSVRLEYASGGRGVACSNQVTPTSQGSADDHMIVGTLLFFTEWAVITEKTDTDSSEDNEQTYIFIDAVAGCCVAADCQILVGWGHFDDVVQCPTRCDL